MSDGPIGSGLAYYAAFQISGNLDQECLKKVVSDIRNILNGTCNGKQVNGEIVKAARISVAQRTRDKGRAKVNFDFE